MHISKSKVLLILGVVLPIEKLGQSILLQNVKFKKKNLEQALFWTFFFRSYFT